MQRFDENSYYRPADEAMRLIATEGTLAVWRHEGVGPPYTRFGNRILYRGFDLNGWMDNHRVEPVERPEKRQRKRTRQAATA